MSRDIQIINNFREQKKKKKKHTKSFVSPAMVNKQQCATRAVFNGQKNVTQSLSRGYESTTKAITCSHAMNIGM